MRTGLELERFDHYYLGVPEIERVVIRPSDTSQNRLDEPLRGEVDMVTDVPPEAVEFVQNDDIEVISFAAQLPVPGRVQLCASHRSTSPRFDAR